MSESTAWITNDESNHQLRRIIEAFPASKKSYVLELKEDLENYVRRLAIRNIEQRLLILASLNSTISIAADGCGYTA